MHRVRDLFGKMVCIVLALLICGFWVNSVSAQQIPHLIRYEGDLKELLKETKEDKEKGKKDKDEKEKKKGKIYDLTFRIYNVETEGEPLWEETHPDIEKKEFEVLLGSINSLDLPFDEDYWLSIEIEDWGEIEPRERMTSVAYAYMAEDTWKLGGRYYDEYALTGHSHLIDHGELEGLADDDHMQYLTNARGDQRYAGSTWDGVTRLDTAQAHIANHNNPHAVTLAQLGHIDNNPAEEAPTLTERGEPTGAEIREWADDITAWGHANLVTNLNADMLDGKDSSEFATMADIEAIADGERYAEMVEGQVEVSIASVLDPTYYTIPDMSITHAFNENPVEISFTASIGGNPSVTIGGIPVPTLSGGQLAIFIDGVRKIDTAKIGTVRQVDPTPGGWTSEYEIVSLEWLETLPEGEHTIEIRWRGALVAPGASEEGGSRVLIVKEI